MTTPRISMSQVTRKRTGLLKPSAGRHLCSGVCPSVDALQCWNCHLGVDLRGLNVSVAKNLLNDSDIGSVLVHQRCHCVPKQVTSSTLAKLRILDVFPHDPSQLISADLAALSG